MKRRLCASPGCFSLTDARYCPAHAWKQAEADKAASAGAARRWAKDHARSPEWEAMLRSAAWRKVRAAYLAGHPLCECGCGARATTVDHLYPGDLGRALDMGSLQALAQGCHNRKSSADSRRGR